MENSIFLEKPSCARIEPYGVFAMKEKINKLARGIVDQEKPSTHFSLDCIKMPSAVFERRSVLR